MTSSVRSASPARIRISANDPLNDAHRQTFELQLEVGAGLGKPEGLVRLEQVHDRGFAHLRLQETDRGGKVWATLRGGPLQGSYQRSHGTDLLRGALHLGVLPSRFLHCDRLDVVDVLLQVHRNVFQLRTLVDNRTTKHDTLAKVQRPKAVPAY